MMFASARFHDRKEAGRLLGQKLARTPDAGRRSGRLENQELAQIPDVGRPSGRQDGLKPVPHQTLQQESSLQQEPSVQHASVEPDLVVLGLPRGGVPVAAEVARALEAPLDVFIVRKLGVPGHEELAMGAIASGGVRVLNQDVLRYVPQSQSAIESVAAREAQELQRREKSYRRSRPPLDVRDKTVIVVDDGLATGSTMRAAVEALRKFEPQAIVVAVPVAAKQTCDEFRRDGINVICLRTPEPFEAVGLWYDDFSQTTDEEVQELLDERNPQNPDSTHRS